MTQGEKKCVLLLDEALPIGVLANTAAILGITLGRIAPECVGPDVADGSGVLHPGIVTLPVPVLKSTAQHLRTMRKTLCHPGFSDVTVVDFSDVAQGCHQYEAYTAYAAALDEERFTYLGLLLYGNRKKVAKLTGSLPLFR